MRKQLSSAKKLEFKAFEIFLGGPKHKISENLIRLKHHIAHIKTFFRICKEFKKLYDDFPNFFHQRKSKRP